MCGMVTILRQWFCTFVVYHSLRVQQSNQLYIPSSYKIIFTFATSHWTSASSVKTVSGVTLSRNAPGSIKCPYFDTIISHTLKNYKRLKKLRANSANDHVVQSFEAIF